MERQVVFDRMDGRSRAVGIALVVLSFWAWWPLGLASLAYLAFGRRMRGWGGPGAWSYASAPGAAPWGRRGPRGCGMTWCNSWGFGPAASGNHAFDDYRSETLRRLEEEQQEFQAYLERLRQARDKSEFDGFMAERRARQAPDTTV